jgi:hypothetical protein
MCLHYKPALFKIRWTPLRALALVTFGDIFDLAFLKQGLHFDLTPAGTEKFLGCAARTGVLAGLSHDVLLAGIMVERSRDTAPLPVREAFARFPLPAGTSP